MPSLLLKTTVIGAVVIAALYQFFIQWVVFEFLGYGRAVQTISTFTNVQCQKVDDLGLEGCEHMWLNDRNGLLYMACSDSPSRVQWLPAMGCLNATGRGLTDRVVVVDTRGSGTIASRIRNLTPHDFSGINGDGTLNLHGLDIWEDSEHKLHILLINHRPPFDPITGQALDAVTAGANSTIELFELADGAQTMNHIRTYHHDSIQTPNSVAWLGEEAFVFTNDHSSKIGFRRNLDNFIGGGSIGYCDGKGCKILRDTGLNFPNGIVQGHDGFIYTASSVTGEVKVLSLDQHRSLTDLGSFKIPIPVDNLSIDKHGHILAAGFPQVHKLVDSVTDPYGVKVPNAVYEVQRNARTGLAAFVGNEWHDGDVTVTRIMEDDGTILSGFSSAVHDAEAGRIFLGGPLVPWIAICETTIAR